MTPSGFRLVPAMSRFYSAATRLDFSRNEKKFTLQPHGSATETKQETALLTQVVIPSYQWHNCYNSGNSNLQKRKLAGEQENANAKTESIWVKQENWFGISLMESSVCAKIP